MSSEPIDKELYKKVKKLADEKFQSKTGIYKSSWIVKEYKKRGGKYKGVRPSSKQPGLRRWYKEKWIDLNRPIKEGNGYEQCGRPKITSKSKYPLCRPSKKVTSETPVTYQKLTKKSINKAKREKSKIKSLGNIKFELRGGDESRAQYYGKKSSVMIKVPENVKKVALYSFKIRDLGFEGGIETGWKRAKQLATKESIPIQDLRYMRSWFARHIYTSYPSYKDWIDAGRPKTKEWHHKRGIIAWLIWGGDPALKWVNSQKNINLLNKYFNKNYTKIKL
jgi:hypothetical protein